MEYATEIHQLLNLSDEPHPDHPDGHADLHDGAPDATPGGLPIPAEPAVLPHAIPAPAELEPDHHLDLPVEPKKFHWKNLLIYPVVFFGAFLFFYLILNFSSIFAQVQGFFTKPQATVQLGADQTAYYKWIESYYFGVSDMKILDPNNDITHDGLTNMDKYIMHLNPIVADTDGDGYPDGLEILTGHNPAGPGLMTDAQKQLAAGLDMNLISERLAYYSSPSQGMVSGASTTNYDLSKAGKLSIPRLNLQVPLIFSPDPSTFETDLTHGVIHYPGTALPGQQGIMYVSGHSSDYIWKKDPFATVFTKINYLQPGDDVFVDVYGLDGKTQTFRYQVTGQKVFAPDDQAQFVGGSGQILNLSTCWPIGSTKSRIVVSAIQVAL